MIKKMIKEMLHTCSYFLSNIHIRFGEYVFSLWDLSVIIISFTILSVLFWKISNKLERFFEKSTLINDTQKVIYIKVARVILIIIALLILFNISGINATSLTILTGSIGVSIGFGLQKIFSNLISGIILLADKSIKPGDVISLGKTYGIVKDFKARYISIISRDGKKHIIPNENLITEKVENWSYNDTNLRLSVDVHISYKHDPVQVEKLLLNCANKLSSILETPKPYCILSDFTESSMIFEIRFWVKDPVRLAQHPQSELRMLLWKELSKNKISFSRDINEVWIKDKKDIIQNL